MDAAQVSYPAGLQALLALSLILQGQNEAVLEEPFQDYLDRLEDLQASQLLDVIAAASRLLEAESPVQAPPLLITGSYRIFVGSLSGPEIRMRPMVKALFLLMLRHPEGILLKDIADYEPELSHFYSAVSCSDSPERIASSLQRLINLESREVNVSVARIRKAVENVIDKSKAAAYLPSGDYGEPKRIRLDRRFVYWLD